MTHYYVHYTPNQKVVSAKYERFSEYLRAEARLARALGDDEMANRWDRQAEMEEEHEKGN